MPHLANILDTPIKRICSQAKVEINNVSQMEELHNFSFF